jgi:hypothetical protein
MNASTTKVSPSTGRRIKTFFWMDTAPENRKNNLPIQDPNELRAFALLLKSEDPVQLKRSIAFLLSTLIEEREEAARVKCEG